MENTTANRNYQNKRKLFPFKFSNVRINKRWVLQNTEIKIINFPRTNYNDFLFEIKSIQLDLKVFETMLIEHFKQTYRMFNIFKVSMQCESLSNDVQIVDVVLSTVHGFRQNWNIWIFQEATSQWLNHKRKHKMIWKMMRIKKSKERILFIWHLARK